jgi:hypothetical protein
MHGWEKKRTRADATPCSGRGIPSPNLSRVCNPVILHRAAGLGIIRPESESDRFERYWSVCVGSLEIEAELRLVLPVP